MHIFCVHGFLAPKAILWPIARRLNRAGYESTLFGYPSHRGTLDEHAQNLAGVVNRSGHRHFGFVGHSMGGLVIRAALDHLKFAPRRMVFISTPHQGCQLMRTVRKSPFARLVGRAAKRTGYGVNTPLPTDRCGTIVGTRDRTVRPDEGSLPGAARLELPYAHNELVLRPRTANAVTHFFRTGHFEEGWDLSSVHAEARSFES